MSITFQATITSDGLIRLPEQYKNLADRRVSVTITDDIDAETSPQKDKILKYAGIWRGLGDEALGLETIHERHFQRIPGLSVENWKR